MFYRVLVTGGFIVRSGLKTQQQREQKEHDEHKNGHHGPMRLPPVSILIFPCATGTSSFLILSKLWSQVDVEECIQALDSNTNTLVADGTSVVQSIKTITTWVPSICVTASTLSTSLLTWKLTEKFQLLRRHSVPRRGVGFVLATGGCAVGALAGISLSSALSIGVAKKQAVVSIMDAVGFKLPWN